MASLPSPTSATTSQLGWDSRIFLSPERTTSWSSAINIRVMVFDWRGLLLNRYINPGVGESPLGQTLNAQVPTPYSTDRAVDPARDKSPERLLGRRQRALFGCSTIHLLPVFGEMGDADRPQPDGRPAPQSCEAPGCKQGRRKPGAPQGLHRREALITFGQAPFGMVTRGPVQCLNALTPNTSKPNNLETKGGSLRKNARTLHSVAMTSQPSGAGRRPSALRRCWLFLPGADAGALAAASVSGADVLIQELE